MLLALEAPGMPAKMAAGTTAQGEKSEEERRETSGFRRNPARYLQTAAAWDRSQTRSVPQEEGKVSARAFLLFFNGGGEINQELSNFP